MSYEVLEHLVVAVLGVMMCSMFTVLCLTFRHLDRLIKEDAKDKDNEEAQMALAIFNGLKISIIATFTFFLLRGFIK